MTAMFDRYRHGLEGLAADEVEHYCVREIAKSLRLKDEYGFDEEEKSQRRIFALRDALVAVHGKGDVTDQVRNLWHRALTKVEAMLSQHPP